jgi:hypothetical protein
MKQQETAMKGPALLSWISLFVLCCLCAAIACFAFAIAVGMAAVALLAVLAGYVLKPEETRALICALSGRVDGFRRAFQTFAEAMRDIVHTMSETAKSFTDKPSSNGAAVSASQKESAEKTTPS